MPIALGEASPLPALAAAARSMVPNLVSITQRARALGVPVMHCTGERRPDGRGANSNARIFRYMATTPTPLTSGTEAAEVLPEIGFEPTDFGVSVNVAIQNAVFENTLSAVATVTTTDEILKIWDHQQGDG